MFIYMFYGIKMFLIPIKYELGFVDQVDKEQRTIQHPRGR